VKAAFHFEVSNNRFGNPYGENVENLIFSMLLERPLLNCSSKIYSGDLLLHLASGDGDDFNEIATKWVESVQGGWHKFGKKIELLFQTEVFIVCFDAIEPLCFWMTLFRFAQNSFRLRRSWIFQF
jgi:hypothetical protein